MPSRACNSMQIAKRCDRREALRIGGLTSLGLSLPGLLARRSAASGHGPSFGRAKQCILLYLHGGHPQQETFDPKPNGPSAVRGEFGVTATSRPGLYFSDVLPQTAQIADRVAIIRSMSHENANHVQASLPANTGHKHPPNLKGRGDFPPSDNDFPPFGAVLDALRPGTTTLPNWVRVGPLMRRSNGTVLHGQVPGFLGSKHASFVVDQSLTGEQPQVEAIQPAEALSSIRLQGRQALLQQFDQARRLIDHAGGAADQIDPFYDKAFSLLSAPETRRAFDLAAEPASLRSRYGMTEFGQRCLLARRLAEAGVPMVNVSFCHTPQGSWDTHSKHFPQTRDHLAPTFDAAFAALVTDLEERGLLDETLVIATAEFGRTPAINKNGGRDHWPWVYSVALAGAGVAPGVVHGASDESAAYPTEDPHDPADFAATVYHLLGIADDTTLYDAENRPHHLVIGSTIDAVLS